MAGTARVWIEFEVSRADPVANHAKFATANLFEPRPHTDTFVSMVSAHVDRGRHNLAASTIYLMRASGMSAFQTLLLPQLRGEEIRALNHRPLDELIACPPLDVAPEVERALSVSRPAVGEHGHQIYFASNLYEVMLNARRWNEEASVGDGRSLWGRRTVTFFVHDRASGLFAPSKFCAFVPVGAKARGMQRAIEMDICTYTRLDESETRSDGAIARRHLEKRLGMHVTALREHESATVQAFWAWHASFQRLIRIHPKGPYLIRAPDWWAK